MRAKRRVDGNSAILTAIALLGSVAIVSAESCCDKAKAEGKVVWYTSTPIEQGQKIVGLFEKKR